MSTTLEILQAYPLGTLEVKTPDGIGRLVALPMGQMSRRVMADVVLPIRPGQRLRDEEDGELYSISDCTPILRPFSALTTPLPDGTVPAVEVAKLLSNDWAARYSYAIHEVRGNRVTIRLIQWDAEVGETLVGDISILADWNFYLEDEGVILHFENVLEAYDTLRRNHFAVGLSPDQFIPKA